tara:strand:+ start:195 stop:518 length:324 start_codon:yes stop_codon:yes gene_type:complete
MQLELNFQSITIDELISTIKVRREKEPYNRHIYSHLIRKLPLVGKMIDVDTHPINIFRYGIGRKGMIALSYVLLEEYGWTISNGGYINHHKKSKDKDIVSFLNSKKT